MYAAIGTMMFSAGSNLAPGGELIMDKSIKNKINQASLRFDKLFGQIIRDTCGDNGPVWIDLSWANGDLPGRI